MLSVRIEGLDKIQRQLRDLAKQKVPKAVSAGMKASLPAGKSAMRDEVRRGLKVSKSSFPNVMNAVVQDADASRMPQAVFFSRAGWMAAFTTGVTIKGKRGQGVLIPINTKGGRRIGYRTWQKRIRLLAAQGNLEFRKVKGKVLVYAENLKGSDAGVTNRALRGHNRKVGKDRFGKKRSVEIPIAILVRSVTLRKRLDFNSVADRQIRPAMARNIQAQIDRIT